jgi:Na+-translocating ferredoxin:NAD+ oxidoreductase subunit B
MDSSVIFTGIVVLAVLAAIMGAVLGFSAIKLKPKGDSIVEEINRILPQTQCGQCGYPGCKPYAQAIADGDDINKCPPGGDDGIKALADMLGRETMPLADESAEASPTPMVAYIREDECIGCTKCIQACPVDAILGAAKLMHTVIESECTGCDLCVEPCPVDCIDMLPIESNIENWAWPEVNNQANLAIEVKNL